MFGLGALHHINDHPQEDLQLGGEITRTCHESYDRMPTKIGPESFDMSNGREFQTQGKYYILRPGNFFMG